ncbi:unnamed protein product [Ilex paraguariensis]|uniref:APO domain-containing protein n=1 Tax=Ilex paraguariensis TaxID=185542 RepID=A0ABC8QLL7_9AQUA
MGMRNYKLSHGTMMLEGLIGYFRAYRSNSNSKMVDLKQLRPMIQKRIENRAKDYPVIAIVPVAQDVLKARTLLYQGVSTLLQLFPLWACNPLSLPVSHGYSQLTSFQPFSNLNSIESVPVLDPTPSSPLGILRNHSPPITNTQSTSENTSTPSFHTGSPNYSSADTSVENQIVFLPHRSSKVKKQPSYLEDYYYQQALVPHPSQENSTSSKKSGHPYRLASFLSCDKLSHDYAAFATSIPDNSEPQTYHQACILGLCPHPAVRFQVNFTQFSHCSVRRRVGSHQYGKRPNLALFLCRYCSEVHISDKGHLIRTCGGYKHRAKNQVHEWIEGGLNDILVPVETFHLQKMFQNVIKHNQRFDFDRIPAVVELCLQAGIDPSDESLHSSSLNPYSAGGVIGGAESLSPDDLRLIARGTLTAWETLRSGVQKLLLVYPAKVCKFCSEVHVGPSGHKARLCGVFKYESWRGAHFWKKAEVDDLVPSKVVWFRRPQDSSVLVDEGRNFYGHAPAVVDLCTKAGALAPAKYRCVMKIEGLSAPTGAKC